MKLKAVTLINTKNMIHIIMFTIKLFNIMILPKTMISKMIITILQSNFLFFSSSAFAGYGPCSKLIHVTCDNNLIHAQSYDF